MRSIPSRTTANALREDGRPRRKMPLGGETALDGVRKRFGLFEALSGIIAEVRLCRVRVGGTPRAHQPGAGCLLLR